MCRLKVQATIGRLSAGAVADEAEGVTFVRVGQNKAVNGRE